MTDDLKIRVHGDASLPTLVYLPGMHGDCTLVSSFRAAVAGRVRFVEFTYPQTNAWALEDYGRAIEEALLDNGVLEGWMIGESFGSQPAWQLIKQTTQAGATGHTARRFRPQGLVLAGGLVRHPTIWAVRIAHRVSGTVPLGAVKLCCRVYAGYAKFRHTRAPETLARIKEFVVNRTTEADRRAITCP